MKTHSYNGIRRLSGLALSLVVASIPALGAGSRHAAPPPGNPAETTSALLVSAGAPTITSFSPGSASTPGTWIYITGTNLDGGTVAFNGVVSSRFDAYATYGYAMLPAGATTGRITVTTTSGTATSATDFVVPGSVQAPTLTSLSPTSGLVGSSVVITGTNLTGASAVTFNSVSATAFTINSATQITATVPVGATTGAVSVTTPGGTANGPSFTVTPAANQPVITSFSPTTATAYNTWILINGQNLVGATISFNGVVSTRFDAWTNGTGGYALLPVGATTGKVTATTAAGTTTSTDSLTITAVPPAPTLSSLSPTSGKAGDTVTLTGSNFTGASAVKFGGVSATISVVSDTQITAVVPSGAVTGAVSVTTGGGTVTGPTFTVTVATPTVSSLSPTSGLVGSSVVITGTNLTGATAVKFNGVSATAFTVNSATQITATVPAGALPGAVSVTTPGGTVSGPSFTVTVPAPSVSTLSPTSGAVGSSVMLTGTNLTGATSVSFGGSAATFVVNSDTQITATVPAGAMTGVVSVTTPGGTANGPSFTVNTASAPTITNLSPNPMTDYNAVLITGTNLVSGSSVYVGNALITNNLDVQTGGTYAWLYLNGIPIPNGKVRVVGTNGSVTSAMDLSFNLPQQAFSSMTPTSATPGTLVTITGTNLQNVLSVNFNGVAIAPTSRSATSVTAYVPAGATTGTVSLTNASGTVNGWTFTVLAAQAPTISGITPALGQPGTTVTVTGNNFFGATSVRFNGMPAASYAVLSPNQITAVAPVGVTTGPVQVVTSGGTANGPAFTAVPNAMMPHINDFNPSIGRCWDAVYITGVNLLGATNVDFAGKGNYAFSVINDNLIKAEPYWQGTTDVTGPITVTTPNGTITSPRNFTIKAFNATDATVTSVVPNHGKPWDHIRITGTGLNSVTSIYFGGGSGSMKASFTVLDANTLDVVVPGRLKTGAINLFTPHASTGWGLVVTSSDFVADPLNQPAPIVSSFTPTSTNKNWTLVTVKGRYFSGATGVGIGASGPGDFFYVLDDSTIQIQTPMWSTTGPITVTTPAGTGTSTQNFRGPYLPGFWTLSPDNHAKEGDVYRLNVTSCPGVTAITVGGVPAAFTQVDDFRLDVTIPVGALSGYITLTNTNPATGVSNTAWSYDNFFITPTLTGMSPATGTAGTTVTLSGRNFQNTTAVTFGGVPAISFKILSGNQIQAVVPTNAVSGPIAIVNRVAGTGSTVSNFTVVNPATGPVIADIVPATAAVGDKVILSGSRLTSATAVSLGGANATFSVLSDSSILATVPGGATTGVAKVTTPNGSVNSYGAFTPQAARVVDVMINGNFEAGTINWHGAYGSGDLIANALNMPAFNILPQSGTWTQTIGGWGWQAPPQNETRTIDAPTSDAITIPADATKVELRFLVGMSTEENTGVAKDFFNVKLIDSATNTLLPNGQVLQLTNLTGSNHVMTPYVLDITAFKGRSIQVRMESDEDKELGTAWTMDDVQVLVYGSASSVPNVGNVFPTVGFPEETVVTLNGTNLRGIQKILFNGVPALSWNQLDPETVETKIPFGASTGQIVVVTGAGATTLPGTFTVNYHLPVANYVEPTRGPVGTPVALLGNYMRGTTSVKINGMAMAFTVDSDNQISTVIPAGATTGAIQITGPGGTASTGAFTVLANGTTADLYIDRVEFIQVTQREDGTVPMVKDRQALARVHVKGNTTNTLKPSVKLTLYQGTTKVFETTIANPTALTGAPTSTSTADFDKTWNVTIPAQYMQPGLSVLAQVNPDSSQPEVDSTNNVWPYGGTPAPVDVRDTQKFKLTMVPLSMTVKGTTFTGDVNTSNLPTWTNMFNAVWPLPDAMDVQVHAPYNTQNIPQPDYSNWMPLLAELKALRLAEVGNTRYYYGALDAWWWDHGSANRVGGGSGMADDLGVLQAMGIGHEYGGTKSPYTWRQGTLAHELGHALSRGHTPCGGAGAPDNAYPYDNGLIGAWGYGFGTNGNEDGGANINIWDASKNHDIMGYCGFEWVSDYCYNHVMDYRLNYDLSTGHAPAAGASSTVKGNAGSGAQGMVNSTSGLDTTKRLQDCVMVWGHVENGEVVLYPSFIIKSYPTEHDPNATYQAEVVTESGISMGLVSFEPGEPDHGPRVHGFNVLMPVHKAVTGTTQKSLGASTDDGPGSIRIHRHGETLAEQHRHHNKAVTLAAAGATEEETSKAIRLANGKVRFTWEATAHPMVMIKNEKGEVITFARGGSMDLITDAKVFDVHFSDDTTSTGRSLSVR